MTEWAALLSKIEDPFNIFPLQTVSQRLAELVDHSEAGRASRAGWWGVSPKYQTVEDEHDIEVSRLLVGSAFVLAQAAIVESVSNVAKLRGLSGNPSWIPCGKIALMDCEARIHPSTGVSEIVLINAVANYVKHHYEWPPSWTGASEKRQRTIDMVLRLGLSPSSEGNRDIALRGLGASATNLTLLGMSVQEWRERMAMRLRNEWDAHALR